MFLTILITVLIFKNFTPSLTWCQAFTFEGITKWMFLYKPLLFNVFLKLLANGASPEKTHCLCYSEVLMKDKKVDN